MFSYFSNNYVWNLSVNIAIGMGAQMGEIDQMCRPLLEAAQQGDDRGTDAFRHAWEAMADKLIRQADEDKARGRQLSAATKLRRASMYLLVAERMLGQGAPTRDVLYRRMLDVFAEAMRLGRENCERVTIAYGGRSLAGYFTRAENVDGPAPVLIHCNGLDSLKEMIYFFGSAQALARRGVSSLCVDQPGTGEALRLHGMKARFDSEHWASAVVDVLQSRTDVDPQRIGMWGISLGGYFCPRAVAMEPRLVLGAVFGANHNWYEVQQRRLRREGDRPVPHYWDHVRWVWGGDTIEEFMAIAANVHLNGVVEKIRVPFLVTHGSEDRQIPLDYAHQTFAQLVNSPKRELKIFDDYTGGTQHAGADNPTFGIYYIADWVSETFAELGAK